MTEKEFELYDEIVIPLSKKFAGECEQFLISGSLAFKLQGIDYDWGVKDVDFLVINPSKKLRAWLEKQDEEANPDYPPSDTMFNFKYDGLTRVDVFIEDIKIVFPTMTEDGIAICPISKIVATKKSHNRSKDWNQLIAIADFFTAKTKKNGQL